MISFTYNSFAAGSAFDLWNVSTRRKNIGFGGGHLYGTGGADGAPSGKVGLIATTANSKFDYFRFFDDSESRDMAGRWINWVPVYNGGNSIKAASGRLQFDSFSTANYRPLMLKGLRLQKFQATFAVRREATVTAATVNVVVNGTDQDDMDYLKLSHANTKTAPFGYTILDGAGGSPVTSETRTSANMPTLGQSDVMWVRVKNNGSAVTVKCVVNAGTPTEGDWTNASNCYSSSSFRSSGGMIGFKSEGSTVSIDDVTIKSWNAATSAFDVTEMYEPFTVDASGGNTGFANETTTNDNNGNLTYDGTMKFTYDAWNRLVKAAHAYRDSGGTLQAGQTFETTSYDGRGRRISKAISGTGSWDCTFHYYYDHESVIEERNGSGLIVRQNVWGLKYIDELVQEKVSSDPTSGGTTLDKVYWAMQDANFNVLGVVDLTGTLKERYEYTPYGQRTVFFSPGTNDAGCYAPTIASRKITSGSITQPWGVCEFGHQGLGHDEEMGVLNGRGRIWNLPLGRGNQRDPAGYVDGGNLYQYVKGNPITHLDPSGNVAFTDCLSALYSLMESFLDNNLQPDVPNGSGIPKGHSIENDKYAHCYYSCRVTVSCGSWSSWALGRFKEWRDEKMGEGWSAADIAADDAGISIGKKYHCDASKCHEQCKAKYGENPWSVD